MPDETQVRLPISNYPIGTIVCHHTSPGLKWRIIKQNRAEGGDSVESVTLQKVGGEFNRGAVIVPADNEAYIAIGGRLRGRMRTRAALQRAAATPPEVVPAEPSVRAKLAAEDAPMKRAAKNPKAASPKPPGNKSKGSRSRSKASVPITSLKIDPNNPFGYESRIHAYFQAILDGDGRATYGQMVASCLSLGEKYGITDTEDVIRRDLNNQTCQWGNGKWGLKVVKDDSKCLKGKGGRLAKGEHDKVVFKCLEVCGIEFSDHIQKARR